MSEAINYPVIKKLPTGFGVYCALNLLIGVKPNLFLRDTHKFDPALIDNFMSNVSPSGI